MNHSIRKHGYFQQPNVVGKFVYPLLTASEIKTFAFVLQQTLGWNRAVAPISTSFFVRGTSDQMGTGLSDHGQRKAVKSLLQRGWMDLRGRRRRGNGKLECSGCGRKFVAAYDSCERIVCSIMQL
jgi:hypothetical protein